MQDIAHRTIMGIGSLVVLLSDGESAVVEVIDDDPCKTFSIECDWSESARAYLHPYLYAPASVLAAVNQRPSDTSELETATVDSDDMRTAV